MNLTEAQRQDMMYLRRIYLTRRCLHAMERQALLARAAINRDQMPLPSDNLTHVSDLAARLQKNATEDYRVYHRVACAGRRGVSNSAESVVDTSVDVWLWMLVYCGFRMLCITLGILCNGNWQLETALYGVGQTSFVLLT